MKSFIIWTNGFILLVSFRKNRCHRYHNVIRWELVLLLKKEETRSLKIKQQHQLIKHCLVSKFLFFYFFIFSLLCSRKILFWPNEKVAKPHESSRHIFSYYCRLFFLGRLPSMMWLFKFDFFFFWFCFGFMSTSC